MRGAAFYAQHILDFRNISEKISENQGAQSIFGFLNIFNKKFLKIKVRKQFIIAAKIAATRSEERR